MYHGQAGAPPVRAWSVSAIEPYLHCPFKFFAQHVLRLEEEPDDEEVMDPRRQGQFVHRVFEHSSGRGRTAVTGPRHPRTSAQARAVFGQVVDRSARAPVRDRGRPGADAAARIAGRRRGWARRCCGWKSSGRSPWSSGCSSTGSKGSSRFETAVRTALDRAETESRSPRPARRRDVSPDRLQARVAAESRPGAATADLQPLRGTEARPGTAAGDGRSGKLVPGIQGAAARRPLVLRRPIARRCSPKRGTRLVDAVDAIARGEFPPRRTTYTDVKAAGYAAVCRKDYVGDV